MIDPGPYRLLLLGHWYDALAALLADAGPGDGTAVRAARELAELAARVLDLDAEDFMLLAGRVRRPWAEDLAACGFPVQPRDAGRGALASLVPLYRLMLEEMDLRAARHEPLQMVVTAHLIGEYLPQLAWESRLGHAGDPLRLGEDVGERWGSDDPTCAHPTALRGAARRALAACASDEGTYRAYLDKFHSRQGEALAVCAMNHRTTRAGQRPDCGTTCPKPCSWALRGSDEERSALDARCRLALLYRDSPVVALRHHSTVGHVFAVPTEAEIGAAWQATWEKVSAPWRDGANPLQHTVGAAAGSEALPGLSLLVSAVAGRPVGPGGLVRAIGADLWQALAG